MPTVTDTTTLPTVRELTFLFADVEGSTRLAERHGSVAASAMVRYHELVATAAERHGGRIFERIGDGAYAAVPRCARGRRRRGRAPGRHHRRGLG